MEDAAPSIGETFGKYRLVRLIGQGGMGAVYEAVHVKLGQRVALKVLLHRFLDKPDLVGRFEREARASSQIRGANVARVIDVDVAENGCPYMVMELLEGHDLAQELSLRGRLPIEEAVDLLLQACVGMSEVHGAGIVHRDLKPSNLFVCNDPQRTLKILDFGISKIVADTDTALTATETTMGTPLYMSPEQIRSAKHVDGRADVWALGVILFELLTGKTPFAGSATAVAAAIVADEPTPLRTLRVDAPEALERAVMKALAKLPASRHADVGAFAAALLPFGSSEMRSRAASVSGSFERITVGALPVAKIDDLPTVPVAAEAATAAPWVASEAAAPRRSRRWVYAIPVLVGALGVVGFLATRRSESTSPASSASAEAVSVAPSASAQKPAVAPCISVTATAAPSPSVAPPKPKAPSKASASTPPPPVVAPAAPTENPVKL